MARPIKQGLDYFPLDVGFLRDLKVRRITKACGLSAISILIYLLGTIYQDNGYYMQWNEDQTFLVADDVGTSEGAVMEVVKKAIQVGFFDEHMWNTYQILTSRGIQKRYFSVAAKNKKKSVSVDERFLLISESTRVNRVNTRVNPVYDVVNPQSKVKKSKVNISATTTRASIYAAVVQSYQKNIRPVCNEIEAAQLRDMADMYGSDIVLKAIERAVVRNNRSLGYIRGILNKWEQHGYDEGDEQHGKSRGKSNGGKDRKNASGTRIREDWSDVPDGWGDT